MTPATFRKLALALPDAVEGAHHQHPDFRVQGRYVEIVEGSRIVLTHAWLDEKGKPGHETLITIVLEDEGKNTKMTFRQEGFDSIASRDGMAGGWKECFDQLGEQLAHIAGPSDRRKS